MRTVNNLPAGIPKETDLTKFPDSTVINETNSTKGTPVVREVYGDILTNIYKLVRDAGLTPNGIEDNELNGYQVVKALKLFANEQNDIEQILNMSGTVLSLTIDITNLPDKYFCFARAAENMEDSTTYTFKGNKVDGPEYGFACPSGFNSGDELLVVIDQITVRAYNITSLTGVAVPDELYTPLGIPIAYSDSNKIYYQAEGILFSDQPDASDLQASIRFLESDGTILVYEMFLIAGNVLCLTFKPGTMRYRLYKFALADLSTPVLCTVVGTQFPTGIDKRPNVYTDGDHLYISNDTGNSDNDYELNIYTVDIAAGIFTQTGTINVDNAFEKTTNAVVSNGRIYTFVGGSLVQYNLGTGVRTFNLSLPGFVGVMFRVKQSIYYTTDEVAKRWTLPV